MNAPAAGGSLQQVGRLLTLVPLLHSREQVRVDDAARLLGVSPAQVRKDLNVLFMCGLPGGYPDDLIDVDVEALEAGGDGVIRVSNADYLARPLRLTSTEATALIVALRMLRESAAPDTVGVVDRTLAKLEVAAEGATDQVLLSDDTPVVDPAIRGTVDRAVEQQRQLHLVYHVPSRDEETERTVDPHALLVSGDVPYLHAWCHRARDARFFRLDRIRRAELLDAAVVSHPPVTPDLSGGFFAPGAVPRVTLELAPEAAWVPEYYDVEVLARREDGSQEVELPVGDEQWLTRLLLRLAPYARVVGPPEFAQTFTAAARDVVRLYRPDA